MRIGCVVDSKAVLDFVAETGKSFGAEELVLFNAKIRKSLGYRIPYAYDYVPRQKETVVILDRSGGVPLESYKHPLEAMYLVGSNRPDEPLPELPAGTDIEYLKIRTPVNYALWSCIALGIVLYDRAGQEGPRDYSKISVSRFWREHIKPFLWNKNYSWYDWWWLGPLVLITYIQRRVNCYFPFCEGKRKRR